MPEMPIHPAVFQLADLEQKRKEGKHYPQSVQMNLANLCYMHCISCAKPTWPRVKLPLDRVLNTLDWLNQVGTETLLLSGGEALSYGNDIIKILDHAGNIDIGILTSGLYPSNIDIEQVVKKVAWLKVSIDSPYPEGFGHIRGVRPEQFHTVIDNVRKWKQIDPDKKIRNNATISNLNHDHIYDLVKLGVELGIETRFYPVHTMDGLLLNQEQLDIIFAQRNKLIEDGYHDYLKTKTNLLEFETLAYRSKPHRCFIVYYHCVIDADGEIFLCCRTLNDNDTWDRRDADKYSIGNINQGDLKDIFYGDRAKQLMNRLWYAAEPVCKSCDRYNAINQAYGQMLSLGNYPTWY